jgi:hypothetical protein
VKKTEEAKMILKGLYFSNLWYNHLLRSKVESDQPQGNEHIVLDVSSLEHLYLLYIPFGPAR